MKRISISTLLAAVTLLPAHGQEHKLAELPKHLTPVPYVGIRNWHVSQNLGTTGARAWVYGHINNTEQSRELLIKSVEKGSPADGILQPYDVIVGAAIPPNTPPHTWKSTPEVKTFDSDARLSFARAVTWAESDAGQGKLQVMRSRDGKTETVTIQLPVMGTYNGGHPLGCPKSQKIVTDAAAFVAKHMPADGYDPGVGGPQNANLLLASHNPAYLDHVRRSAVRMSLLHTVSDAGHETWRWGNTNTFLCEYYLATGDDRVLPTITEFSQVLQDGQCNPGTWGHRGVPDYVPPGYGSVNSTGVVCFYSLVLANQAGVNVADKAIANSIGFYGSYVGRGSIPYGDHAPYNNTTGSGKNGGAALAFYILGADPASQWFARLCASANLNDFEGGHTGNYFNQTWTPLGASLTGGENYANFWQRFNTYRDLARRWDGSFISQPYPNKREGDLGSGTYLNSGPMWNTGSFAMSYLANSERLGMLGRRESVFGTKPPSELSNALALFRSKDFAGAAAAAAEHTESDDSRTSKMAKQLEGVALRNIESIDLTLAAMNENLAKGDLYTVKYQLLGIEGLLEKSDARLKPFYTALENPEIEKILQNGALYDRAVKGVSWHGTKGFQALAPTVHHGGRRYLTQLARKADQPYGQMAADLLKATPEYQLGPGKKLATFKPDAGQAPNKPFTATQTVDIASVEALYVSYMSAKAVKIEINGTTVLDVKPEAPDKSAISILLKPSTKELLKPGQNTITITATPSDKTFFLEIKEGV